MGGLVVGWEKNEINAILNSSWNWSWSWSWAWQYNFTTFTLCTKTTLWTKSSLYLKSTLFLFPSHSILCWLCCGVLHFFCRCCSLGEICWTKWPVWKMLAYHHIRKLIGDIMVTRRENTSQQARAELLLTGFPCSLAYLLTFLLPYFLTCVLTNMLICLLANLIAFLITKLLAC